MTWTKLEVPLQLCGATPPSPEQRNAFEAQIEREFFDEFGITLAEHDYDGWRPRVTSALHLTHEEIKDLTLKKARERGQEKAWGEWWKYRERNLWIGAQRRQWLAQCETSPTFLDYILKNDLKDILVETELGDRFYIGDKPRDEEAYDVMFRGWPKITRYMRINVPE